MSGAVLERNGYTHTAEPGPCRWCGQPAYTKSPEGRAHPCCDIAQSARCQGCKGSSAANAEWARTSTACPECGQRHRTGPALCPVCERRAERARA